MQKVANILPSVVLLLAALACLLNWGLASDGAASLPLVPLAAVFAWGLRRPQQMPAWLVFLVGLLADALTGGPLGYWSLIYLIALASARRAALEWPSSGTLLAWLLFAGTLAASIAVAWAVASIYDGNWSEWHGQGLPAAVALAIYPVLDGLARKRAQQRGDMAPQIVTGGPA